MNVYVNGKTQGGGGGGSVPGKPSAVLVDASKPNTVVALNGNGVGESLDAAATLALIGAVPTSRTVNAQALSADITLTAADVGADPAGSAAAVTTTSIGAVPTSRTVNAQALSGDITLTAADVGADPAGSAAAVTTTSIGAVPTTRTVNSKALSSDITLSAADVGADPAGSAAAVTTTSIGAVPTTRTVNSKALSSDITLSAADVGADPAGSAAAVTTTSIGAVPTSRTVNSKALSSNITLSAADVGADPAGSAAAVTTTSIGAVPTSRTVAGLALSADISVSALNTALGSNSSLGVRTAIPDTGWTNTTSGTASITRVAGVHTFNVNANGFAIERRATISTAECPAIEVLGRINVTTGTPASGWYSSISLANTADTFGFIAQVHESQKLGLYQNNGAGWTQVALSAGIFSLGAGIWIRLVVTPSYASCGWLATGTNTPPPAGSEWNLGGTVATTIGTLAQSYLSQVGVRSGRPNTGSGTYTTEWTQLQWRILGVSP